MAVRGDFSPKALLRSRRKARKVRRGAGWTKKRASAVEAILSGATSMAEAAKAAGLTERSLRAAFRDPVFLQRYRAEANLARTIEQAQSIHVLVAIRDDPDLLKTPAGCSVIVKACKAIENLGQGSTPGFDIKVGLNEPRAASIIMAPISPAAIARALTAEATEAKRAAASKCGETA